LIFIWAIRLGVFLFLRIQNDGEDKRFRSIKPSPSKFFMTWTLQATWVSICSLCALTGISCDSGIIINNLFFIGVTFFVLGFVMEVVADSQKTKFRKNPKNKNTFINSGLWAYSRHPNYLGEIFIWTGISVISFSSLSNWQFVTLISPIFTYVLLVYVSGVRLLEASGNEKWGHLKSYKEYTEKTPCLLFK
jgi:steroid 5-alpha reductase family enzyme